MAKPDYYDVTECETHDKGAQFFYLTLQRRVVVEDE